MMRSAAGNYEDQSAGDDVSNIGGQSQMSRSRSKRDKKKRRNQQSRNSIQGLPDQSSNEDDVTSHASRPAFGVGNLE